jgi:hypothetical protein
MDLRIGAGLMLFKKIEVEINANKLLITIIIEKKRGLKVIQGHV